MKETGLVVIQAADALRDRLAQAERVAFVPTMGNLHAGHMSLVEIARRHGDCVVASIFVNRLQFGPNEDFDRYPRTLEADRIELEQRGVDVLFAPREHEMYPVPQLYRVQPPPIADELEGAFRPGFFHGVCTVVLKLLNIVAPDAAYFGAKDFQQSRIIQQLVRDLNVPVEVKIEPTAREADGLALSSRNRYLSSEQRAMAPAIFRALQALEARAAAGEKDVPQLEALLQAELAAIPGAKVDYARIVAADTLQALARLDRPAVAAVAVFLGETRLIDNLVISG